MRALLALAVCFAVVAMSVVASAPDVPMCVIVAPNGKQVNLSTIAAATYPGAQLATSSGLVSVNVAVSWCKELSASVCNRTGLSMAITNAATGACVAAFTAVAGPGNALTNTTFSISEWSASSGAMATVTVTCDTTLPAGAAKLTGVVTNSPFYIYNLNFNSSAACATSSSSSSQRRSSKILGSLLK